MTNDIQKVKSFAYLKKLHLGNSIIKKFIVWMILAQLGTPFMANLINQYINNFSVMNLNIGAYLTSFMNIIILTIVTMILMKKLILSRIKELIDFTEKVSGGDLSGRLSMNNNDEITMLGQGINLMVDNLAEMVRQSTKSTERLNEIANGLNNGITTINDSMQGIAEKSEAITVDMSNIRHTIEEARDYVEELNKIAQKITATSQEMAGYSASTNEMVIEGKEKTNVVANEILNMKESFRKVEHVSHSLEKRSKDIESIIETINKIAEQTAILALNAKIESARAGEYGKGFSVVAEEIRNLAQDTSVSVKEIGNIIHTIQSEVQHLTRETGEVGHILDKMKEVSKESYHTLERVASEVSNVNAMIQEISVSNERQSSSLAEFSSTMAKINESSDLIHLSVEKSTSLIEETTQSLQEISKASNILSETANETKEKMLKIKL